MVWANSVGIVTGASEGIGAACVRAFKQLRVRVSLNALASPHFVDRESDDEVITTGDITNESVRSRIVERTLRAFGRIDFLVNNVGVGQYGYPTEVDTEISKRMYDINVFAPLALTQLAIPVMQRQKSGVIVNMGSVGGKVSLPWAVMYCSTKWAVHCIDDSLRRELRGTGIHVVKICPGIVDTKFRENVLAGAAPRAVAEIRRVVTADQVAAGVVRGIERKKRTVYVPKIGFAFTALEALAPWAMDLYLRGKT
jgi:short-subunit dehydrogenase